MSLRDLLDRPIAFHRCLIRPAGSVNAALMLSQALYWSRRTDDEDGWFYKTREEWEEETGLCRSEQEIARKQLRSTDFWEEDRRGVPAQLYYRINLESLQSRLQDSAIKRAGTCQQEGENLPSFKGTETTTENTAESSAAPIGPKFPKPQKKEKTKKPWGGRYRPDERTAAPAPEPIRPPETWQRYAVEFVRRSDGISPICQSRDLAGFEDLLKRISEEWEGEPIEILREAFVKWAGQQHSWNKWRSRDFIETEAWPIIENLYGEEPIHLATAADVRRENEEALARNQKRKENMR